MSCLSMNTRVREARFESYAHQPVARPITNLVERLQVGWPERDCAYRSEPHRRHRMQKWLRLLRSAGAFLMTLVGYLRKVPATVVSAAGGLFGNHRIKAPGCGPFEGKQLGQYRVIARLGAGGMGEVYLAEHRLLERPCAIKFIKPDRAGDPQVLARFEREVRMTARLSHWNNVEIFDCGRTEDGALFYVMEYLPGLSLEDLLERHGPLGPERAIHLLRQICQALREAHGIGLIHRDIKPANVFVAQRGGLYDVAKLLDFGLVKPVDETASARLTQEGVISGTPLFMSPEQAVGRDDLDAPSDIYSMGAVAYAMITGRPPFGGTNPLEVMIAHARDSVAPPSRLNAEVPEDLERVILRCLAKRPEDRFQNVEALEKALSRCAVAYQWTQLDAACWWKENEAGPWFTSAAKASWVMSSTTLSASGASDDPARMAVLGRSKGRDGVEEHAEM
jgi:eukaryotic-like serine/threonine-protein kinase